MRTDLFLIGLSLKLAMKKARAFLFILTILLITAIFWNLCVSQAEAKLPSGVKAVWDLENEIEGHPILFLSREKVRKK